MAYDPNSHYEPPRRAYYDQTQRQAPAQNGYGNQYQEQYEDYAQQSWNGEYDQQYDNGYGQDIRQARAPTSPQYQDNYNAGYQSSKQQSRRPQNGYEERPPRQERQYDPRYQQRPDRGRQQQQQQQYDQPPLDQQSAADRQYLMEKARPNPKNARIYPGQSQAQSQPYAPQPVQSNVSSRPQTAPKPQSQPQKRQHDPSKMSMEEWKAKERARMHEEALSPETLAWDNAFPTFPTKRERSRPATANRESAEHARPETGAGHYQEDPEDMSRGASYNHATSPQREFLPRQGGRPVLNQQPHSFDGYQQASLPQQPQPQFDRMPPNQTTSPIQERSTEQWPVQGQRTSPLDVQADRRRPPPSNNMPMPQHGQEDHYVAQQGRQGRSRGNFIQPIDTGQLPPPQRPAYMDHQPLSPASVPQRPSTAQGSRAAPANFVSSPTSAYPTAQSPQDIRAAPANQPPNSWSQRGQSRPQQVNDNYANYGDNYVSPVASAAPRTREQEIEADMPDFDSAAPGGTSLLHKRTQHAEKEVVTQPPAAPLQTSRMPPQQSNSSSSLPTQHQGFYNEQQEVRSKSLTNQHGPKQMQGGITDGFVFEVPDESAQQQHYDAPYQQGQPDIPYELSATPVPAPFAREQQPKRSMDDARQIPYRQGPPPQQRMNPNRGPPRGPPPQQQRPGMDRQFSGHRPQPGYADPMGQRGGSAPPTRQPFQEPPGRGAHAAPLQQQRSAPDAQGIHRTGSNPDSLPSHPTPVRPGHMEGGSGLSSKPPPVRQGAPPPSHQRSMSLDQSTKPITRSELDRLRASVDANPNNSKQALLLVKKLVEASTVLAPEGGRVDARTAAKNREAYIMDAHKRLKRLVAGGYAEAQFYMADCYGSGSLGLEVDPREAFNLYQAAAKAGHAEAAYRTAMCCEMGAEDGGGTRKDYAKAVQWYRRAAALGDSSGMFKVGIIFLKGLLGQPKNVGEGVSWLKRVAERGDCDNPQALYELATLYESANTNPEVRNKVVADDAFARELFDKAAHMGHKYAQFRLGQAHEYGSLGLAIDNRQSIAWYSKAAAQGEHQAELALSGWYLTGAEGILEHSDMEAYLWARKAAISEPPLAKALFAMGYFTETGIGCPASLDEAKKWYGRAASYNFPKARERLEELKKNGIKGSKPVNGKLTRKDQKRDEAECVVM